VTDMPTITALRPISIADVGKDWGSDLVSRSRRPAIDELRRQGPCSKLGGDNRGS
jgi:hypothetical protein